MLDALDTHLKSSASPESHAAISEACDLFDAYELQDTDTAYLDLLMTADNADIGEVTQQIHLLTEDFQDQILRQLQVTLSPEASIQHGNLFLRSLKQLEKTEFNSEIVTLCDEIADPSESLCEVISLLSGHEVDTLYPLVETVGGALIMKIKETVMEQAQESDVEIIDTEAVKRQIDRMIRFKLYCENPPFVVYELVLAGLGIGLPYKAYHEQIVPLLTTAVPKVVAMNLYAAAILSSDAGENPRPLITEALNTTYTSADVITPVMTALEGFILGFNASETSGVTKV